MDNEIPLYYKLMQRLKAKYKLRGDIVEIPTVDDIINHVEKLSKTSHNSHMPIWLLRDIPHFGNSNDLPIDFDQYQAQAAMNVFNNDGNITATMWVQEGYWKPYGDGTSSFIATKATIIPDYHYKNIVTRITDTNKMLCVSIMDEKILTKIIRFLSDNGIGTYIKPPVYKDIF